MASLSANAIALAESNTRLCFNSWIHCDRSIGLVRLNELFGGSPPRGVDAIGVFRFDENRRILNGQSKSTRFRGQLTTALEQLAERERLKISLYDTDGLKLGEIGEVSGRSESRTSRWLSRACDCLRKIITVFPGCSTCHLNSLDDQKRKNRIAVHQNSFRESVDTHSSST